MSSMKVIYGAVSTSMVIQLSIAFVAIMKDQVKQLDKIGAAATTTGIEEEPAKNGNFEIVSSGVNGPTRLLQFVTSVCAFAGICRSVFDISTFHFQSFTSL